jgi:hypothetical protein
MENVYILASPCELIKNYIFHDAATLRMLTLHGISVKSVGQYVECSFEADADFSMPFSSNMSP